MENVIISALADLLKPTISETIRETMLEINAKEKAPEKAVKDYMLMEEFADLLGVTPESARVMKCKGKFPARIYFKRGKRTFFRRAEVMQWLEEGNK